MGKDKKRKNKDGKSRRNKKNILDSTPSQMSPVEKIIFDKYGDIGLRIYTLIDGNRTAEEMMHETGFTEAQLVEMLDFMDEQGIIKLDYPKIPPGVTVKYPPSNLQNHDIVQKKNNLSANDLKLATILSKSPFREWKQIDDLQKEVGLNKSQLMGRLKFMEKRKQILLNYRKQYMPMIGIETKFNATEKRLYDKTSAKFGMDAISLYFLIDGKIPISRLRAKFPKAKRIVKILVDEKLAVFDPYKKGVLFTVKFPPQTEVPNPKIIRLSDRSARYYEVGIFSRAEEELTKLINKKEKAEYYINRGAVLYKEEKFKEAIADLTRAIELGENLLALYDRAICHIAVEQYENAINDLTKIVQNNPEYADAYYLRGLAVEFIGKEVNDAIADFEKALRLKPDFADAEKHLAKASTKRKIMKDGPYDLIDAMVSIARIKLSDVQGKKKLKDEKIMKILRILKNPEEARKFGLTFGGGIIFYGPPGCGKNYITEAIAGEANVNFIRVDIGDTLNMYVGNSEKNLKRYFEYARERQPCILFFDEMEALGGRREGMRENWARASVNTFLMEMDKIEKNNYKILVIGATNAPWDIDHALTRSGRFTDKIFIGPPEQDEREDLFKFSTRKIQAIGKIDFDQLAKLTEGLSCADIVAVCNETAGNVFASSMPGQKIKTSDFVRVIEKAKEEGWFNSIEKWLKIAKEFEDKKPPPDDGTKGKELAMFG